MAKTDSRKDAPATNDAYTGMLAISLLALLAGCALLYLDYSQYAEKPPATPPKAPPVATGAAAPGGAPPPAPIQPAPKEQPPPEGK